MEKEDEINPVAQETPPPLASLESRRSKVTKKAASTSASISVEMVEGEEEEEEEENNSNMKDELSISASSSDGGIQGEGTDEVAQAAKGKRGAKRVKGGISLSPSKGKVKKVKRSGCWKYFKEIQAASKQPGVMVSKAKCRFCYKSYVYHPGGATTQLNRHLKKCTQYLNKLAKAKAQLAQGRR